MLRKFFVVAICIALSACVAKTETVVGKAQQDANSRILERCRTNSSLCIGGFVVKVGDGKIYRIVNISSRNDLTIGMNDVAVMSTQSIERIVLPNDRQWSVAAVQYMRQFVLVSSEPK